MPIVAALWRFPVKSLQGEPLESMQVTSRGVLGDRRWALIDDGGHLMSAKRYKELLLARANVVGDEPRITLPTGEELSGTGPALDEALSRWVGRAVRLVEVEPTTSVSYQMTLDPPNDDAEWVDIPAPRGSFVDLAPLHLIGMETLAFGAATHQDLDWDVRRFRPNVVLDGLGDPFAEDRLVGATLRVGGVTLVVRQPTVRCAVPLRAQPGLSAQPALFRALDDLHDNHLGVYADIVEGGTITMGDEAAVVRL